MTSRRQEHLTHEWIDQRSLAMHTEMAQMIREKPELLDVAKTNLQRWINNNPTSRALLEWDAILKNSTSEEALNLITRDDEDARRLRQSSPFCGILPEERRLAIFQEFEKRLLILTPVMTKSSKPTIENSLKPLISKAEYQRELVESFGEEWAAICQLPEADRMVAIARIHNLQGESPRDRAWPTEGGSEPAQEEGWDSSGSYRPAAVRQVYEELVATGKIQACPNPDGTDGTKADSQAETEDQEWKALEVRVAAHTTKNLPPFEE